MSETSEMAYNHLISGCFETSSEEHASRPAPAAAAHRWGAGVSCCLCAGRRGTAEKTGFAASVAMVAVFLSLNGVAIWRFFSSLFTSLELSSAQIYCA